MAKKTPRKKKTLRASAPPKKPAAKSGTSKKKVKPYRAYPKSSKKPVKKSGQDSKAASYEVVPLSAKTGKEIKKPKTGQDVHYGLKGPKGGIKKIAATYSQKFADTDLKGLNKLVKKSGGKNFVVYEELTKEAVREKGKIKYKKSGGKLVYDKGKPVPVRKTKITAPATKKKQRPVLMEKGKRVRELDLGFRKRSKREQVDAQLLTMLPIPMEGDPFVSREMHLTGETIRDTIKNLHVPVSIDDMQRSGLSGLWVEGDIRVEGVAGLFGEVIPFSVRVEVLANFTKEVSAGLRRALANVGYRFTSLVDLQAATERVGDEENADGKKIADLINYVGGNKRRPYSNLLPIIPERGGDRVMSPQEGKAPKVYVNLHVQGF